MEWAIREIQIKTVQWHTTVWSPERLKLERRTEPNIDEHENQPQSSLLMRMQKKKKKKPTGNKAGWFITNSNPYLPYDLRNSYLEFAQGNIKPLPRQTCACKSRSSSLLLLTTKIYPMPTSYGMYPYNGMLLMDKNEWTIDSWNSLNSSHTCCILLKLARLKSYIIYDAMYMEFYKRQISRGGQWLPGARESSAKKLDVSSSVGDYFLCLS